jgi:hypothetical protein
LSQGFGSFDDEIGRLDVQPMRAFFCRDQLSLRPAGHAIPKTKRGSAD